MCTGSARRHLGMLFYKHFYSPHYLNHFFYSYLSMCEVVFTIRNKNFLQQQFFESNIFWFSEQSCYNTDVVYWILDQLPDRKCNAYTSSSLLYQQEENEGAVGTLGLRTFIQYGEGPLFPLGRTCLVRLHCTTVVERKVNKITACSLVYSRNISIKKIPMTKT